MIESNNENLNPPQDAPQEPPAAPTMAEIAEVLKQAPPPEEPERAGENAEDEDEENEDVSKSEYPDNRVLLDELVETFLDLRAALRHVGDPRDEEVRAALAKAERLSADDYDRLRRSLLPGRLRLITVINALEEGYDELERLDRRLAETEPYERVCALLERLLQPQDSLYSSHRRAGHTARRRIKALLQRLEDSEEER